MKCKLSKLVIVLATVCAISGQAGANGLTQLPASQGFVTSTGTNGATSFQWGPYTDVFGISFASLSNFTATTSALNGDGITTGIYLGGVDYLPATTTSVTETLFKNGTQVGSFTSNGVASGTFSKLVGTYTLQVSTANDGSNFSGYTLTSSVTPVPEPTEGVLLLSGIGLLGFIAARRKTA